MTKIRALQISETLLKPILEVRAAFAGQEAAAAAEGTAEAPVFGLAHPIHVMGLRDLLKDGKVSEAPVAIRVLESSGPDISAFYDVSPSNSAPEVLQMAGANNDYAAVLERGIDVATHWAEEREGEADLRLLRIPALNTEALLLRTKGQKEEIAIVIRTLQPVETLRPMPLSELVKKLEGPARLILENDDGRKFA